MTKEAEKVITKNKVPKKNIFITGTVKDLVDMARIGNGDIGKVFRGKLTTREIGGIEDTPRTQFSIEISSQSPNEEKPGKTIVMEKIVGERENFPREKFEIFNLELHKKRLGHKERCEQIKEMPHFRNTRDLVLRSMGGVDWDLVMIENKLPGAKGLNVSG